MTATYTLGLETDSLKISSEDFTNGYDYIAEAQDYSKSPHEIDLMMRGGHWQAVLSEDSRAGDSGLRARRPSKDDYQRAVRFLERSDRAFSELFAAFAPGALLAFRRWETDSDVYTYTMLGDPENLTHQSSFIDSATFFGEIRCEGDSAVQILAKRDTDYSLIRGLDTEFNAPEAMREGLAAIKSVGDQICSSESPVGSFEVN